MKTESITDSQALQDFLSLFEEPSAKLSWPLRRKLQGKMLLSAFMAQYLSEKSPQEGQIVKLLQAKGHSGFSATADQAALFQTLCSEVNRMWGL